MIWQLPAPATRGDRRIDDPIASIATNGLRRPFRPSRNAGRRAELL